MAWMKARVMMVATLVLLVSNLDATSTESGDATADTTELPQINDGPLIVITLDLCSSQDRGPKRADSEADRSVSSSQLRLLFVQWALDRLLSGHYELKVLNVCLDEPHETVAKLISLASTHQLIPSLEDLESKQPCQGFAANRSGGVLLLSQDAEKVKVLLSDLLPHWNVLIPYELADSAQPLDHHLAIMALIKQLRWDYITVLGSNDRELSHFERLARKYHVCIANQVIFDNRNTSSLALSRRTLDRGMVILGGDQNSLDDFLNMFSGKQWVWNLAGPLDWNEAKWTGSSLMGSFAVEKAFYLMPEFFEQHNASLESSWEDHLSMDIAKQLILLASSTLCQLNRGSTATVSDEVVRQRLALRATTMPYFNIRSLDGLESQGWPDIIGHYSIRSGLDLSLNMSLAASMLISPSLYFNFFAESGSCMSDPAHHQWRYEPWVTAILTVGTMGIVFTLMLMCYLCCKTFFDLLDGSQMFSFCLLTSLVLMYLALIPYALSPSNLVCMLRSGGTRLVYALVFSGLLSRSILLATADMDGLPGHASGWVQLVVFSFAFGVQVSLVTQEFLLLPASAISSPFECHPSGYPFLYSLSYIMLLMLLQLLLSPVIFKSSRNYREGLLFSMSTVACVLIWIVWMTCYILVPEKRGGHWHDISVCLGLVATPTVINLVLFVPKCYFMSSAILYKTTRSGEPLTSIHFRDLSDMPSSASSRPEAINLNGTTTTCSTTDDALIISRENSGNLHGDIYASFKGGHNRGYRSSLRFDVPPVASPTTTPDNYPTFKLDRNSIVDTSIRWERYNFQPQQNDVPAAPPLPPPRRNEVVANSSIIPTSAAESD